MDKMKKFLLWLVLFILLFCWSRFFAGMAIFNTYKKMDRYQVLGSSPEITIIESKKTNINGYIRGTIYNNTNGYIREKYLKVAFYNKEGEAFGVKGMKLAGILSGQTLEFKIPYKYTAVDYFIVEVTDTPPVEEIQSDTNLFINFAGDIPRWVWYVSSFIVMMNLPVGYLWII